MSHRTRRAAAHDHGQKGLQAGHTPNRPLRRGGGGGGGPGSRRRRGGAEGGARAGIVSEAVLDAGSAPSDGMDAGLLPADGGLASLGGAPRAAALLQKVGAVAADGGGDETETLEELKGYPVGGIGAVADLHQHTLLHKAAASGKVRCLEHLLAVCRVHPEPRDTDDKTPLHHAAHHNHPRCVEVLLRYGADADAKAENRKFKSSLCRHFMNNCCPFGDRCHFAHGKSELRGGSDAAKRRVTTPLESAIKGRIQARKKPSITGREAAAAADDDSVQHRRRFVEVCGLLRGSSREFPKVGVAVIWLRVYPVVPATHRTQASAPAESLT
jgi:hypothetical protein